MEILGQTAAVLLQLSLSRMRFLQILDRPGLQVLAQASVNLQTVAIVPGIPRLFASLNLGNRR
jgi:hypothetical protein